MDTNFTVGTIFGVWPGDKLTGVTGGDQVAAAMGIYGPRTTYVLALKDAPGTHEFLLLDEGIQNHTDRHIVSDALFFIKKNMQEKRLSLLIICMSVCNDYLLSGRWQHVKDTTEIGEGKMFSPGNLRATSDNPEYAKVCLFSSL